MSLLEVQDVTVRFGGHTAVSSVSLKVDPGRITGLIGPNGAGKTTLFNVITGLQAPTRGKVVLDGQEIGDRLPFQRARLGMGRTFQRLELFGQLTARENIQLALGLGKQWGGAKPLTDIRIASPSKRLAAFAIDLLFYVLTAGLGCLLLLWTWKDGQTPGKKIVKIKYFDLSTGRPAGWLRSAYRDIVTRGPVAYGISLFFLFASPTIYILVAVGFTIAYIIGSLLVVFDRSGKHRAGWDRLAGTYVIDVSHLASEPAQEDSVITNEAQLTADELLERVGLTEVADVRADALPTGQGRLVELARALAIRPRLLLLDEPASGQDEEETKAFAALLRSLAGEGMAILLVEHDMELVMQVCSHIYVLDFGQLMAEGDPATVRSDPKVQAAYLGTAKEVAA